MDNKIYTYKKNPRILCHASQRRAIGETPSSAESNKTQRILYSATLKCTKAAHVQPVRWLQTPMSRALRRCQHRKAKKWCTGGQTGFPHRALYHSSTLQKALEGRKHQGRWKKIEVLSSVRMYVQLGFYAILRKKLLFCLNPYLFLAMNWPSGVLSVWKFM